MVLPIDLSYPYKSPSVQNNYAFSFVGKKLLLCLEIDIVFIQFIVTSFWVPSPICCSVCFPLRLIRQKNYQRRASEKKPNRSRAALSLEALAPSLYFPASKTIQVQRQKGWKHSIQLPHWNKSASRVMQGTSNVSRRIKMIKTDKRIKHLWISIIFSSFEDAIFWNPISSPSPGECSTMNCWVAIVCSIPPCIHVLLD